MHSISILGVRSRVFMQRSVFLRVFLLLILSLFSIETLSVKSQNSATTASIDGVTRDRNGAAAPSVAVTVRNTSTNLTRQTTSDDEGNYRFSALPVGTYQLSAESGGFARYDNPAITLSLGTVSRVDIVLEPAGVGVSVTVNDRPPLLDASQTASTTSIDPERIEELPISSRNYLQFALLAPGVAPSNPQTGGSSAGGTNGTLADSGFTFGGLRPRSNSIAIDGLDNTDETTGSARVGLSPEIVREFQVVNNGLTAEFGGAAGGAINVITRDGTNEFHGDAFLFAQNEIFNAREQSLDHSSPGRDRFRRFQTGVALGGPIISDRLFFYSAIEQEHLSTVDASEIPASVVETINTALGSGFAPRLSTRSLRKTPFPVGLDETETAARITYVADSNNTMNLRYSFTNVRDRGSAFNTESISDQSTRGSSYTKDHQVTASLLTLISPRIVNEVRSQFSTREAVIRPSDSVGPGIQIVGEANFGRASLADGDRREVRVQILDNVTFTRARDEWKIGFSVNHVSLHDNTQEGFGGIFTFGNLADFLAGKPAQWRQTFGTTQTNIRIATIGAFVQNQKQLTPRLTVNAGLRYDIERLPQPFRTDKNNVSPRLGVAWSPSSNWIVRSSAGILFDRLPLAYLNSALQKNGIQAFEQFAIGDAASAIFAETLGGSANAPFPAIKPSIFRSDPEFETPYSLQANIGIERQITKDVSVSASYLFTRGIHLPRTRNINLLPPVVLTPANSASLGIAFPSQQQLGRLVFGPGRINPQFDAVYQLENSASSKYHGMTFSLNKRLSNEFELLASYTLSKTLDDASDFNEQPANPYDLRAERALSGQDVRNRFVVSALFDLPIGDEDEKETTTKESNFLTDIFSHIEAAPILTFNSGRPVDPLTGTDEERNGAFFPVSRPTGLIRNSLKTAAYFDIDLRVLKYFPFGGKRRLDLVVEAFNLLNHSNVSSINPVFGSGLLPSPEFQVPTASASPRKLRFSLDLEF